MTMCRSKDWMGIPIVVVLACAVSLVVPVAAMADDVSHARVYTVKVSGSSASLADLQALAKAKGSVEVVTFPKGADPSAAVSRTTLRAGEGDLGYLGFSVKAQEALVAAQAGGAATSDGKLVQNVDGAQVQYTTPKAADEPLTVTCVVGGSEAVKATVYAVDGKPGVVEVTFAGTGLKIVQVYEYIDGLPAVVPSDAVAGGSAAASPPAVMGEIATQSSPTMTDDVSFHAQLTGVSWGWDSKWWPGEDETPGGFPIQFRFDLGLGADISSDVAGSFQMNYLPRQLQIGAGSGSVLMDFGAELSAQGSLNLGVIDPIVFDIPFVPQFDLRVLDSESFSNWLLDSTASLSDGTDVQQLANLDLLEIILKGVSLPDWVKKNLSGGIGIAGALAGAVTMTCDSISLSDGTTFTTEGESKAISLATDGYHVTANYNEAMTLTATLKVYPTMYVNFLFLHWTLPTFELPWNVYSGPIGIDFSNSGVDFPPYMCKLNITKINPSYGEVVLDPAPADANAPEYPVGTAVTLTAVPGANRSLAQWEVYDVDHPGDANYALIDTNSTITITMDRDYEVGAVFKCGSGIGQAMPLLLVGLMLGGLVAIRRRR